MLRIGAAVIAPFGSRAYLGAGGATYIDINTGGGTLDDGTLVLGVTSVRVEDTDLFGLGPLWNNARPEVQGRLIDIVRQILNSGDCVYWFEGQTHKVGHPAKLPDLFKTTGLNFYLSGDSVSLGSLPTKPTPLDASKFGISGDAVAQTLGRGTSNVQIVLNRSYFDEFNNARWAEELIHEMFHAAGLRGSAPYGSGVLGWRRANDLNPEVQWGDIRKHCGQYIK